MREKKAIKKDRLAREVSQGVIVQTFGKARIKKERKRLCRHCVIESLCHLMPICLDGSDCPYFKERQKEEASK